MMKVKITKKQLILLGEQIEKPDIEKTIHDYLFKLLDFDNLRVYKVVEGGMVFINKEPGEFEDDVVMRYYLPEYWDQQRLFDRSLPDKSPIIGIEKIKDEKTLDGYFGDKWKPVLKKIIEKKFNLPVKTVGFDN